MSLKIEDVKVGDGLICIDVTGFIKSDRNNAVLIRLNPSDVFVVKRLEDSFLCVDEAEDDDDYHSGYIAPEEFKYFKKKEQSQHTFDDLIDVAAQAFKDRVIFSVGITICAVGIKLHDKSEEVFTIMDIDEGIDFIQSLYKETFVIEIEEDLKRVKSNPKITLNNGEVVPFTFKETAKDHLIFYDQACGHNLIPFVFLKGATVEQERGRSE